MRSEVERRDQQASWGRTDDAFFAAGACHVLAFTLLQRCPDQDFTAIYISPHDDLPGGHVYVSGGAWAFDFNGWTREGQFLAATAAECRRRWPQWNYERIPILDSLEWFCQTWNHRLPSGYAGDVIERANAYLDRFPRTPSTASGSTSRRPPAPGNTVEPG